MDHVFEIPGAVASLLFLDEEDITRSCNTSNGLAMLSRNRELSPQVQIKYHLCIEPRNTLVVGIGSIIVHTFPALNSSRYFGNGIRRPLFRVRHVVHTMRTTLPLHGSLNRHHSCLEGVLSG
jgi:hypothetical protein